MFQVKACAIRSKFLVRELSLQRPPSQSLCGVFHSYKAELDCPLPTGGARMALDFVLGSSVILGSTSWRVGCCDGLCVAFKGVMLQFLPST